MQSNIDDNRDNRPAGGISRFGVSARRGWLALLAGVVAPIVLAAPAWTAPGDLDPGFGDGGKVTTDFTGAAGYDEATAMVALERGKTIVVGFACTVPDDPNVQGPFNGTCDFSLARYNRDGSLDENFGSGGKVTTGFGAGTDDRAYAVVTQQGKYVVAGATRDPATGNHAFAVARYNAYGKLDTTFGVGGKVKTSFPLGTFAAAEAVAVRGDFITVVGTAGVSFAGGVITGADFAVARYKRNGKLDATFGDGGLVTTNFPGSISDEGQAVALQPDGKIVVAGVAGMDLGILDPVTGEPLTAEDIALLRYNPDGSLDETFGDGGKVATDFAGNLEHASAVAIKDGRIVVVGSTFDPVTGEDFALAAYDVDED
jgi:uncharacterized delta-60 repeat protein